MDSDLREYSQSMALSAIARRQSPRKAQRQFHSGVTDALDDGVSGNPRYAPDDGDDPELALALQASMEDENDAYFVEDTRLATALSIAGAGPSKARFFQGGGRSSVLPSPRKTSQPSFVNAQAGPSNLNRPNPSSYSDDIDFGIPSFEPVVEPRQPLFLDDEEENDIVTPKLVEPEVAATSISDVDNEEEDMVGVLIPAGRDDTQPPSRHSSPVLNIVSSTRSPSPEPFPSRSTLPSSPAVSSNLEDLTPTSEPNEPELIAEPVLPTHGADMDLTPPSSPGYPSPFDLPATELDQPDADMSRPPSPAHSRPPTPIEEEDWEQVDHEAEEGEFAKFLSHVKGKDLDQVQREIDDEIRVLNQQQKAALRDSEMDVNGQMVAQIMVRPPSRLGIDFVTHPSLTSPCFGSSVSHT